MNRIFAVTALCFAPVLPANASILFSASGTLGLINGTSGPDFLNDVYFDATTKQLGFSYADLSFKIYNDTVLQALADASLLSGPPANPTLPPAHNYELRLTLGEAPHYTLK